MSTEREAKMYERLLNMGEPELLAVIEQRKGKPHTELDDQLQAHLRGERWATERAAQPLHHCNDCEPAQEGTEVQS